VPANTYFVMGDNRDHSYDSRFWGYVPMDAFRGKAYVIYFSWQGPPGESFLQARTEPITTVATSRRERMRGV
jgi:hypothetical protein